MLENLQRQLLAGMGVAVLILVIAQLIDCDYRSAAVTTASFCGGFLAVQVWLRCRKSPPS